MSANEFDLQTEKMIEIQCGDRWQVYRRLQELEIPCLCSYHQPLRVQVDNAVVLLQVWSVVKQVTLPRQVLVSGLEDCWKICSSPKKKS